MPSQTQESSASRVAAEVKARIVSGQLRPGQRLTEDRIRGDLGVSRSTLREGFRTLVQERLVVHHLARGFFVRELTRDDLVDIYALRRILECSAVRNIGEVSPEQHKQLAEVVAKGEAATEQESWQEAAQASVTFHQTLVDLADSPRLSDAAHRTLVEFRLAYVFMDDPFSFHVPFIARHAGIAELIIGGENHMAAETLEEYLRDSKEALLAGI
ncbi:GntR family transcriptional regulator [Nesterenkonia sp. MY13]|uniref:GntR family transcriptional regulator n=1 Tax=Nesterenkonia sedimenti TaxID=1463632 RepID=A0A7X8TJP6_9MICC|nr:GntR family transcriptional regulator [Nesterenkonia sedimenti]NLS10026.1 GntR family transcriptional regulator [Nesterenkonia sedimenti]